LTDCFFRTTRHNRGAPGGFRSKRRGPRKRVENASLSGGNQKGTNEERAAVAVRALPLHAWDTRSDRVTSSDEDAAIICSGVGNEHVLVCLPQ
jgi:hypothetical protein